VVVAPSDLEDEEAGEDGGGLSEAGDGGEEVDGAHEEDADPEAGLAEAIDEIADGGRGIGAQRLEGPQVCHEEPEWRAMQEMGLVGLGI
jgi:hypothetical protein